MKTVLLATATALVLSGAAYAQAPAQTPAPATSTGANHTLRQQMQSDLQKAGFSDVHVMPESFLVHAKDSSGNPVSMFVSPDSVTEVTGMPAGHNGATAGNGGQTFVSVPQSDKLSSNVVGLNVTNNSNQDIGTIKDVALGSDGVQAYVLSVGGFLGMGDHYVAVNPDAVKVSYNTGDKKWHATMNATADQLKSAPEFKYTGNKT